MKKDLDAAAGGIARAEKLTPEERREIAIAAAEARWGAIPRATHTGTLNLGEAMQMECAVLDDPSKTRVLTEMKFMEAMGMYRSGALSVRRETDTAGARIPLYLAYKNLKPFVDQHLGDVHTRPLRYRTETGSVAHGIPAEIIPKICEVWLDARAKGVLGARQQLIAVKADILLRSLAKVGVIALVDEATGYQDARAADALAKILEAFVAKELKKWVKTFQPEFYKEMFRLRGLPYTGTVKRPQYIGALTNNLVYLRIAPGVLDELRRKNPVQETGRRKHKHFQWLTEHVGHPKLQQHLAAVTALMRASADWDEFARLVDRSFPKHKMVKYKKLPLFQAELDAAEGDA